MYDFREVKTLLLILIFGISINADTLNDTTSETAATLAPFNPLVELANVTCFSQQAKEDYAKIFGKLIKFDGVYIITTGYVKESWKYLAYTELRKSLDLPPPPPWKHRNRKKKVALEDYLAWKFASDNDWTLENFYFNDHSFEPVIALLDRHIPDIRLAFRRRFEEVRRFHDGVVDRKTIDLAVEEYKKMSDVFEETVNYSMTDLKCENIIQRVMDDLQIYNEVST